MPIVWLLIISTSIAGFRAAQSCNPAVVDYLVRDEKGKPLSETELKLVAEQLPRTINDATVSIDQVSFRSDMHTYYWPESIGWPKGQKQSALEFANAGTCTLHLTEVNLTYHGKKMRLIFDVDISRNQQDRRPVIDALPFQEGAFSLDLSGWSHETEKLIPAARWKKVTAGRS
jgi:hypothetical protein